MTRTNMVLSSIFGTLAAVLLALGLLAVPTQEARASDDPCARVDCPRGQTCVDGECQSTCIPATTNGCPGQDAIGCAGESCAGGVPGDVCSCRWSGTPKTCWCP